MVIGESDTDSEARLYCQRPGQAAEVCYMDHVLHGLVVDMDLSEAHGHAEREAAPDDAGAQRPGVGRTGLEPRINSASLNWSKSSTIHT